LAIERDFRALVHGRVLALAPKPQAVEEMQNVAYTVRHLSSAALALDMGINRVISRSIAKVLDTAPALAPAAVAVRVATDVLGALHVASLSEREKVRQIEDEHRHDREWQFGQVERHDHERER
jgi:hypothetical protein